MHKLFLFGVQLVDTPKDYFTVHNGFKFFFIVDLMSKKHLDPILMELIELVFGKCKLSILDFDGFREKILEEAHSSRYSS